LNRIICTSADTYLDIYIGTVEDSPVFARKSTHPMLLNSTTWWYI